MARHESGGKKIPGVLWEYPRRSGQGSSGRGVTGRLAIKVYGMISNYSKQKGIDRQWMRGISAVRLWDVGFCRDGPARNHIKLAQDGHEREDGAQSE